MKPNRKAVAGKSPCEVTNFENQREDIKQGSAGGIREEFEKILNKHFQEHCEINPLDKAYVLGLLTEINRALREIEELSDRAQRTRARKEIQNVVDVLSPKERTIVFALASREVFDRLKEQELGGSNVNRVVC